MVLLRFFAPLCEQYYRYHDLRGDWRKMVRHQERRGSSLPGTANKLLFILTYMKENPNQAYHGALFGMSQGKVSLWIKQLAPLLEEALHQMGKLPKRAVNQLYDFLSACIETVMLMAAAARTLPSGQWADQRTMKYKNCITAVRKAITRLRIF